MLTGAVVPFVGSVAAQTGPPDPSIDDVDIPDQITLGESFEVEVQGSNDGGRGGHYSTISVASPNHDDSGDESQLRVTDDYDHAYSTVIDSGETIFQKSGDQTTAEYADGWAISVSDAELRAVGEVWRATNTSVEDRSIGPAVVKDILAFVEAHSTASRSVRLTQAVISFICPQLEGVPKREQILRQIATVPDVDDDMLDEAARDMLQVSLNTDE